MVHGAPPPKPSAHSRWGPPAAPTEGPTRNETAVLMPKLVLPGPIARTNPEATAMANMKSAASHQCPDATAPSSSRQGPTTPNTAPAPNPFPQEPPTPTSTTMTPPTTSH